MKRAPRVGSETFSTKFELMPAAESDGIIRGVAMVFGAPIDCYPPSIVERGAFNKTIAEQGDRVKILWQHYTDEPIGKPVSLKEGANGLEIAFKLDPVPMGERAEAQIKSGTLTDLSIGFDPIRWEMVQPEQLSRFGVGDSVIKQYALAGEPVRVIREVRLWEISVVTFGAQRVARMAMAANTFRDLPVSETPEAWDAAAAALRVRGWAGEEQERLSRAYLAGVAEDGKFLLADVVDGKLAVIPEAVFRAALDLESASDDIPARTITYMREHLASYYQKLGRVAPWEGAGSKARLMVEPVASLPNEVFEGRVLSTANMALVQRAVEALNALLSAATPEPAAEEPMPGGAVFDAAAVDVKLKHMRMLGAAMRLPAAA